MSPFESHMNRALLEGTVPAAGAAVAQDQALGRSPIKGSVKAVSIISEANVTANATNFRTIRIVNKGQDGNGAVVIASLALDSPGTDDLADFDEKDVPIVGNAAVAQGDILAVDETVAGTGLAHSGLKVVVEITN